MTKEILIVALTSSVLSSIITALVAPFANWGVEKRRVMLENRLKLIKDARSTLNSEEFSRESFRKSEIYSRLRPFMSDELNEKIMSHKLSIIVAREGHVSDMNGNDILKMAINMELHKIETGWKLI